MAESFTDWVAEFPEESAYDLARKALEELESDWLIPLIAERIENIRRLGVRNIERGALTSFLRSVQMVDTPMVGDSIAHARATWKKLLEQEFAPEPGRRVLWGEATIEDHLARIASLEKHIQGVRRTIDAHRAAVNEIQREGVTCLRELEERAA